MKDFFAALGNPGNSLSNIRVTGVRNALSVGANTQSTLDSVGSLTQQALQTSGLTTQQAATEARNALQASISQGLPQTTQGLNALTQQAQLLGLPVPQGGFANFQAQSQALQQFNSVLSQGQPLLDQRSEQYRNAIQNGNKFARESGEIDSDIAALTQVMANSEIPLGPGANLSTQKRGPYDTPYSTLSADVGRTLFQSDFSFRGRSRIGATRTKFGQYVVNEQGHESLKLLAKYNELQYEKSLAKNNPNTPLNYAEAGLPTLHEQVQRAGSSTAAGLGTGFSDALLNQGYSPVVGPDGKDLVTSNSGVFMSGPNVSTEVPSFSSYLKTLPPELRGAATSLEKNLNEQYQSRRDQLGAIHNSPEFKREQETRKASVKVLGLMDVVKQSLTDDANAMQAFLDGDNSDTFTRAGHENFQRGSFGLYNAADSSSRAKLAALDYLRENGLLDLTKTFNDDAPLSSVLAQAATVLPAWAQGQFQSSIDSISKLSDSLSQVGRKASDIAIASVDGDSGYAAQAVNRDHVLRALQSSFPELQNLAQTHINSASKVGSTYAGYLGQLDDSFEAELRGQGQFQDPNVQGIVDNSRPQTGQFIAPTQQETDGRLEALRNTPGFQFAMSEGTRAVERGAAAKGNLLSGATQKALTTFGQGLADQQFQQTLQNLQQVVSTGTQITSQNVQNQAGQGALLSGLFQEQGKTDAGLLGNLGAQQVTATGGLNSAIAR